MSWVLIIKHHILFVLMCIFATTLCLFSRSFILLTLFLIVAALFVANKIVRKIIATSTSKLSSKRDVKKYSTIVIGDNCSKEIFLPLCDRSDNILVFTCPKRSLFASYQILLHSFSVLEEHGTCIIVGNGGCNHKELSLFDLPFLNFITIEELGLEKLKKQSRWPLFFSPVQSILVLLGIQYKNFHNEKDLTKIEDIKKFCSKKSINLIYLSHN